MRAHVLPDTPLQQAAWSIHVGRARPSGTHVWIGCGTTTTPCTRHTRTASLATRMVVTYHHHSNSVQNSLVLELLLFCAALQRCHRRVAFGDNLHRYVQQHIQRTWYRTASSPRSEPRCALTWHRLPRSKQAHLSTPANDQSCLMQSPTRHHAVICKQYHAGGTS